MARMLRRPSLWILLACAALIAAGWALTLERIGFERSEVVDDAVRQNDNLAVAFEEQTLRTIRSADQALIFLRHQYEQHREIANLRELFDAGLLDDALIPNYLVVDASGKVLGQDGRPGAMDVASTDFFVFLREQPADRLFISRPFKGRVTGKTVISLSRRMTARDGSFAGVVSVGLDPRYFLHAYKSLDLGERGMIQLVGLDGVVRARRIGHEESLGQDMNDSRLLSLAAREPSGHYVSAGARTDGLARYHSYRLVRGYPLVISVGTAEADVFADFEAHRRTYLLGAIVATVLVALFALGLLGTQRRRAKVEGEKRAIESRYRATFDHAGVGIAHTSLDGRFISVNPRFCTMLGYAADELLRRRTIDVTHPNDVEPTQAVLREAVADLAPGPSHDVEKRFVRKDGSLLWALVTIAPVREDDGSPGYFVSMVRDITLRKQQEQRLLEQLDELRRFQKVTVERELRMIELEAEIRALRGKAAA